MSKSNFIFGLKSTCFRVIYLKRNCHTKMKILALLSLFVQSTLALNCYVTVNGTVTQASSSDGGDYTVCFGSRVCVSSAGVVQSCNSNTVVYSYSGFYGTNTQAICALSSASSVKKGLTHADYANTCCTTDLCNTPASLDSLISSNANRHASFIVVALIMASAFF